jgi:hypothetical protein
LSTNQLNHRNQYETLLDQKREMEKSQEEKIKELAEKHQNELEENRNAYSQKMLEDAARFQELQAKKDEEEKNFKEHI